MASTQPPPPFAHTVFCGPLTWAACVAGRAQQTLKAPPVMPLLANQLVESTKPWGKTKGTQTDICMGAPHAPGWGSGQLDRRNPSVGHLCAATLAKRATEAATRGARRSLASSYNALSLTSRSAAERAGRRLGRGPAHPSTAGLQVFPQCFFPLSKRFLLEVHAQRHLLAGCELTFTS